RCALSPEARNPDPGGEKPCPRSWTPSASAARATWPQISSLGANQLAVENSDLRFDAGRKIIFPGDAPLSVTGDLMVSTNAPTPQPRAGGNNTRLIIKAGGNVGIGTLDRVSVYRKSSGRSFGVCLRSPSFWAAQGGSDPEGSASTGANHEYTSKR